MKSLTETLEETKGLLPKSGVEAAEIYIEERQGLEVQAKDQNVDLFLQSAEKGLAIRLEEKGHIGFGYTNDVSRGELERAVTQSYNSLQNVEPKHRQFLPEFDTTRGTPPLAQFDETLSKRPVADKINQALSLEKTALNYDKRVKQVRAATYQEEERHLLLWSSRFGERSYSRTLCQAHLMVLAREDDDQESGWDIGFSPFFEKLDCGLVASEAAEEAVSRLKATSIKTGHYPAVLDRSVVAAFMGILAPSFLGESVQKNKSQLRGKLGEKIYAEKVTIIDDGLMEEGKLSAPYDGEGALSQETLVVSDGILHNYLYDASTAKVDDKKSTGNSLRSGFKEAPRPGTRNFYLKAGSLSPSDLYEGIEEGVAIHDVIGMHTANPITGDFSVGASGYLIRRGKREGPIRGFAISGNLHHIFSITEGVGADLKFYGPVGAPSVRIETIAVSGT